MSKEAGKGLQSRIMSQSKEYDRGWAIIKAPVTKEGLAELFKDWGYPLEDALRSAKFDILGEDVIMNVWRETQGK